MSRLNELKKQHSWENLSIIDMCEHFNPIPSKSKYTELLFLLLKEKFETRITEYEKKRSPKHETLFKFLLNEFFWVSEQQTNTFNLFVEYNEKKLINTDLSQIKEFDNLMNLVSLAELKISDKEMSNQIIKEIDNEDWLVLVPLTYEASLKYGSQTKWCTASRNNPHTFYNYGSRGVLFYCINKKDGNKTAIYHEFNVSELYDKNNNGEIRFYPYELEERFVSPNSMSVWNAKDDRIDSWEAGLDSEIFEVVKKYRNQKLTTAELFGIEAFLERSRKEIEELQKETELVSHELSIPIANETLPL